MILVVGQLCTADCTTGLYLCAETLKNQSQFLMHQDFFGGRAKFFILALVHNTPGALKR